MRQAQRVFALLAILAMAAFFIAPAAASAQPKSPASAAVSNYRVWECYDDGSLDPCHTSLNGLTMVSATDGWAVGNSGLILRWDGAHWTKFASPTTTALHSVAMLSATDGWIVGDVILRWTGTGWLEVPCADCQTLEELSVVSASDIWAVSENDLAHWNGSSWSVSGGFSSWVYDVSMTPGTNGADGWAVGGGGLMLHWHDGLWNVYASPTTSTLSSVIMLSSADGWAVGYNGTVLRWNGTNWMPATAPPNSSFASFWGLEAYSASDIWMLSFNNGANVVYHWNGSAWSVSKSNVDFVTYLGLALTPGTSGAQAWVVGEATTLLRWDSGVWTTINSAYNKAMTALAMVSPVQGWALSCGFPVITGDAWRWDGTAWVKGAGSICPYSAHMTPGTNGQDGWAVGQFGEILHWDGASWTEVTSPVDATLNWVDIVSTGEGWAVGSSWSPSQKKVITVIARLHGGTWSSYPSPTINGLWGVSMSSAANGWAVGDSGTLLRWDSSAWSVYPSSPTSQGLFSVSMLSDSNGWAVGESGTILHWNGSSWLPVTSPTSSPLYAVAFNSPSNGWAVGVQGTILHWDGLEWSSVPAPAIPFLFNVSFGAYNDVWVSGSNGVLLHYLEPPPALSINYAGGAPGSYFTLTGTNFPPDATANLSVNGHSLGPVETGTSGSFEFLLSTAGAEEGQYQVIASVNPVGTVSFTLSGELPIRSQEGSGPVFPVPAGIAYHQALFVPKVLR